MTKPETKTYSGSNSNQLIVAALREARAKVLAATNMVPNGPTMQDDLMELRAVLYAIEKQQERFENR